MKFLQLMNLISKKISQGQADIGGKAIDGRALMTIDEAFFACETILVWFGPRDFFQQNGIKTAFPYF